MSCETEVLALLRSAGHKLTPQRGLVVSALRHADGHLTTTEICARVKVVYPFMDTATVARTVAFLKELHLISEINLGLGEPAYEWLTNNGHHHLVCEACGSIQRFDSQTLTRLGEELQQTHDFAANIEHVAIFGRCRACASRPKSG